MAIFRLLNQYFLKSVVGLLCAFGIPLFFNIMFVVMGKEQFATSFVLIVSSGILAETLMIIPPLIIDLRKSLVLKRIGISKMSRHQVILILVVYFYAWVLATILFSLIIFVITSLILNPQQAIWNNHNVFATIYGAILLATISIVTSVLIGLIFKNAVVASTISFILIFFALFTSGLLFPIIFIRQVKALVIINYLFPFNWPMLMMQEAWGVVSADLQTGLFGFVSGDIFNLSTNLVINAPKIDALGIAKDFVLFDGFSKAWNQICPYFVITGGATIIPFVFRWVDR